nr:hypothetical protein P5640_23575 [Bacillus subtilis]
MKLLLNGSATTLTEVINNSLICRTILRESKDGEKFVSVGPNKKVAYRARFLEWGTSKMPPHPFIEKGGEEGEASAVEVMQKILTAPIK